MPPKMFVCAICGQEVSRPKSWALENLNGQPGRACRHHEEVVELVLKKAQAEADMKAALQKKRELEEKMNQELASAARRIQIVSLAEGMRMLHTIHGIPGVSLYLRLKQVAPDEQFVQEVLDHIEQAGGLLMPEKEVDQAVMMAVHLMMEEKKHKATSPR